MSKLILKARFRLWRLFCCVVGHRWRPEMKEIRTRVEASRVELECECGSMNLIPWTEKGEKGLWLHHYVCFHCGKQFDSNYSYPRYEEIPQDEKEKE